MPSQETFNTNMVANFLSSLMAIYTPYSDKHNKSYSHRQVADQHRFNRKSETNSVGAKVRISSRTELKGPFGQN
jgi:hypothetical protein